jgi:hypothetical protein
MKKWLVFAAAVTAVAILSRRPHPARDVARLEPVQAVYIYQKNGTLCIETDTGAAGSGNTLTEAAADLKASASGEIFLDTAEFLLIDPEVTITADFHTLLRPTCGVTFTTAPPDLQAVSEFLSVHTPKRTLLALRIGITQHSDLRTQH